MAWTKKSAGDAMSPAVFHDNVKASGVRPVLVFFGEEDLLMSRAEAFVKKTVLQDSASDFNFELVYGEKGQGASIAESAATAPFGGGMKLLIVRNSEELKDEDFIPLAAYVSRAPKGSCLLMEFSGGSSPWGVGRVSGIRASFRESVKKNGMLVEFARLSQDQLAAYLRREAKNIGANVSDDAIRLLVEEVGDDLGTLLGALEQASMFASGKDVVDIQAMKAVIIKSRGYTIFELAAALGDRNLSEAMHMAESLLSDDAQLVYHLTMIARHFRILLCLKEMLGGGKSRAEMQQETGVNAFFLEREYIPQARNFDPLRLRSALGMIAEADMEIRTAKYDKRTAVERLFIRLCA